MHYLLSSALFRLTEHVDPVSAVGRGREHSGQKTQKHKNTKNALLFTTRPNSNIFALEKGILTAQAI